MEHAAKIAYQNKDIISKAFADAMQGKSFNVYGLQLPKIKTVISANLPGIEVNELRIDDIFVLEDGSFVIVDYESEYRFSNKIKYLGYILRVVKRLIGLGYALATIRLHVVVIYTGKTKRGSTKSMLDLGAMRMYTHEAFLTEIEATKEKERIEQTIKAGERLSEEDIMLICVMALSYEQLEDQQRAIRELVEMAKGIKDEETQRFTLGAILGFTDKVMEQEVAEDIIRRLTMTKIGRIYEEQKLAYGKEMAEQAAAQATEKTRIDTMYENLKNMMEELGTSLSKAMDVLKVSDSDREILMKRFE